MPEARSVQWERRVILLSPLRPYRYGDSNPGFRTENWL